MNKSHHLIFHQTLKKFKERNIQNKKMIVGVSGGLDSMVLMSLLRELSSVCKLELVIAHIHHGRAEDKKTQNYRDKAEKLLIQTCAKKELVLFSSKSKKKLKSEEEFRNFRRREFKKCLKKEKADCIVLAHSQNDLLETRLINLIRGSGPQGLKSMGFYQAPYLRPLLDFSREQIKKYAQARKLKFLEDPSNKDNSYLRNWIRNKWLKNLEKKRPGSIKSLSRSLEILSTPLPAAPSNLINQPHPPLQRSSSTRRSSSVRSSLESGNLPRSKDKSSYSSKLFSIPPLSNPSLFTSEGINRKLFLELSLEDQKRILASYMRQLNLSHYGQSHIKELLKHNSRPEKKFQLKLLKKTWLFTKEEIKAK